MLDPRNTITGARIGCSHIIRAIFARKQMRAQAACLFDIVLRNCFWNLEMLSTMLEPTGKMKIAQQLFKIGTLKTRQPADHY
jgi:hypothetical protein